MSDLLNQREEGEIRSSNDNEHLSNGGDSWFSEIIIQGANTIAPAIAYICTMALNERKRRGVLLVVIGIIMMMTKLIGLDQVFVAGGVIFVLLGCGDIFYDSRYRRRFK